MRQFQSGSFTEFKPKGQIGRLQAATVRKREQLSVIIYCAFGRDKLKLCVIYCQVYDSLTFYWAFVEIVKKNNAALKVINFEWAASMGRVENGYRMELMKQYENGEAFRLAQNTPGLVHVCHTINYFKFPIIYFSINSVWAIVEFRGDCLRGNCVFSLENLLLDENQPEQPRSAPLLQQTPSVDAIFHASSDSHSLRQLPKNYLQLSAGGQPSATAALPAKPDQTKCPTRHQKLTPRLAVHKHAPINTSTGSSTSGVEISSSSSRSDLPLYPCRKNVQIIESSYDAEDLSSPEDADNPLYVYRTPSFKKAIERGSAPDDPYAAGRSAYADFLEPLPYYPVQHELQLAPSGLSSKPSASAKVLHLIPPPYPFNLSPESSLNRGKSPASSSNHEESSKQPGFRSFAIPEAEFDAVVKSGMDMRRENATEIVKQNSSSQEHG